MKICKYPNDHIFEFDTLDELRVFGITYVNNTRSVILKKLAMKLECDEKDIVKVVS